MPWEEVVELPASEPKTDRELLLSIYQKLCGDGGVCDILREQERRIDELERWRWYIIGGFAAITFLLVFIGRLIDFGIID
jgi:hypothetical protein